MAKGYFTFKLNTDDLTRALKKAADTDLKAYLQAKLDRIIERLANEVAKPIAEQEYGNSVTVTTRKLKNGYEILAQGRAVCFLEFGTGAYADQTHPFANSVPFDVYPGSWSDTYGAGTWSQYLATHPDDPKGMNYRYNHEPQRGLYEAYRAIKSSVGMICREELVYDTD